MNFVGLFLPLIIKLLDKWLQNESEKDKLKKKWLEFIFEMAHTENDSKKVSKIVNEIQTRYYKEDNMDLVSDFHD